MTDLPNDIPEDSNSAECGDAAAQSPLTYQSCDLLQGNVEIQIIHGDTVYRLRETSRGKLILQK